MMPCASYDMVQCGSKMDNDDDDDNDEAKILILT